MGNSLDQLESLWPSYGGAVLAGMAQESQGRVANARRDGCTATLFFPSMCTSNVMPPTATTVKQARYCDACPYARCSTNTTRRRFPSSSTPSPCAAWCGRGTPFFTERLTSSTTLRPWRWRRHWGLQVCTVYAIVFFAGGQKNSYEDKIL